MKFFEIPMNLLEILKHFLGIHSPRQAAAFEHPKKMANKSFFLATSPGNFLDLV